uniref:Uncharacterized protein n=1 Tax=Lepeophtheirus salmonis TaxID=72036 RepID=A0A0K2UTP8_LEPSM
MYKMCHMHVPLRGLHVFIVNPRLSRISRNCQISTFIRKSASSNYILYYEYPL